MGIWSALDNVYPDAGQQRCWNHRMRNVLDCVGKKKQAEAKGLLTKVMYAPTEQKAVEAKRAFEQWATEQQYAKAAERIGQDWERMVAYYATPKEHWVHLRTTNPIESAFATVRHRTKVTKGPGSRAAGLAMAFKLIESAQDRWRAVNAPHLVALVRAGATFINGKLIERPGGNAEPEAA